MRGEKMRRTNVYILCVYAMSAQEKRVGICRNIIITIDEGVGFDVVAMMNFESGFICDSVAVAE